MFSRAVVLCLCPLHLLRSPWVACCTKPIAHLSCTSYPQRYLLQALPLALAAAKDAKGNAFKDALELLLDVLEHVDNSGNIYDPDNFLAAALEALGRMHTDDAEVRGIHLTSLR